MRLLLTCVTQLKVICYVELFLCFVETINLCCERMTKYEFLANVKACVAVVTFSHDLDLCVISCC